MSSEQAQRLWTAFRNAPHKQIDMKLPQRREAGEHAEDPTAEPAGITFTDAPEVAGIWAKPPDARAGVAILYLFGGGYVLGSPASRRKTAGHLARAARARILVPSYRLAPEHKFPAAVDDARRAYQWLIGEGVEPARVVIVGDSAGGGLAVALMLSLREHRLPMPAGCVALSPWADLACTGESMTTRAAVDCMVTREGLLEMAAWYLDGADPHTRRSTPTWRASRHCSSSSEVTRPCWTMPRGSLAPAGWQGSTPRSMSGRGCSTCSRSGPAPSRKRTRPSS